MIQRAHLFLICALIGIGLCLSLWGFWPPTREVDEILLRVADVKLVLPEERTIRLEFSPAPRAGDSQVIELRIVADGDAQMEKNIYDEYSVIAESRLDMPLAEVRPGGVISASLVEGGSATFYWEVSPRAGGEVEGTVWTYLRFVPRDGGAEIRQAVAAQRQVLRPRSVLGWTGGQARFGGVVGLLAGIVLGWMSLRRGEPAKGTE